ncbi:hard surface-induced protein [Grosmannia clavigera kw1407]|uniref:Hard surface-induced protein n=1 Tax=Grosmannia clavigera (strain kw1407 / UAMH 11150) TaxID=655863 RepID=F0X882_GROCL|nr:hard surface-induced protein [Grosmannia clavigera kw1407]EFX06163.1 hard surface-induced protein [Grosmannia clavigera kw1407]
MVSAALNGLRRWTLRQLQPVYEELADEERMDEERKEEELSESSLSSLSSSNSSAPEYAPGGQRELSPATTAFRLITFIPILTVRLLHTGLVFLTEPARRRASRFQTGWPPIHDKLGFLIVFVPSFLQPSGPGSARKLHPSAWLDGLRGIAAFLVVWHHASLLWFSWSIHRGYGSSENDNRLIQLPFLRLVVSGRPQVAIFFVVSGYALSYKPLKLARQGRHSEAGEAIHSSVFRRHPRLFIMPVVVSFVAALMTQWNWYGTSDQGWTGVAAPVRRPPRPGTLSRQLLNWALNVKYLTSPLSRDMQRGRPFAYDNNLWTLPVEFDCSLVIFLCQAAFCRLRPQVRMLLMAGIVCYAHSYLFWEIFLFSGGMLLCDLHFHLDGTGSSGSSSSNTASEAAVPPVISARNRRQLRNAVSIFSFATALFILSIPDDNQGGPHTPGYRTLFSMVTDVYRLRNERDNFWIPPAAVLLVWTIDRTPFLQRPFNSAFAQFLGTISYSMYLVHGPLIWTAGHWLVCHTTALTGTDTDFRYGLGIALSALVLWPIIIYLADLVTRTVDVRAVSFGRWLYERWVVKEPEPIITRPIS